MAGQATHPTTSGEKFLLSSAKCRFCTSPFIYRVEDNFNGLIHSNKFCNEYCAEERFAQYSSRYPLTAEFYPKPSTDQWNPVLKRATVQDRTCHGCGITFPMRPQDEFNGFNYSGTHCSPKCFKTQGIAFKARQKKEKRAQRAAEIAKERGQLPSNKLPVPPLKKNGKRYQYKAPVSLAKKPAKRRKVIDTPAAELGPTYEVVSVANDVQVSVLVKPVIECPTPTKKNFLTKEAGWQFIGNKHKGDYLIHPYVCACGKIHIGH